jgi:cysteine-rich repeat protein
MGSTSGSMTSSSGTETSDATSTASTGESSTETTAAGGCGDGALDPGESCDDGNSLDGDGCNQDCRPSGELLWEVVVEGSGAVRSLSVLSEPGIIVGGALGLGWIARYSMDGAEEWSQAYSSTMVLGVAATDSSIFAGGAINAEDGRDVWCARTDGSGDLIWEQTFASGQGDDYATRVAALDDGGAICTALVGGDSKVGSYRTERLSSAGEALWTATTPFFGNTLYAVGGGLAVAEGEVIVGGSMIGGMGSAEFLVAYAADTGAQRWVSELPYNGRIVGIAATPGAIYVASHAAEALSVRRLGPGGVGTQWSSDACTGSAGRDLVVDAAGDVVVIGDGPGGKGKNIRLCRFSADGALRWGKDIEGGYGDDLGFAVAIAPSGQIVAGGSMTGETTVRSPWLALFSP